MLYHLTFVRRLPRKQYELIKKKKTGAAGQIELTNNLWTANSSRKTMYDVISKLVLYTLKIHREIWQIKF